MGDWQSEHEHRYLVHFSDGGAGMRHYSRPLQVGDDIEDGRDPTGSFASRRSRREAGSGTRGRNCSRLAPRVSAVLAAGARVLNCVLRATVCVQGATLVVHAAAGRVARGGWLGGGDAAAFAGGGVGGGGGSRLGGGV